MASSLQPIIATYKADAAIAKGLAVKIGTDGEHVAVCTAASDKVIGITQVASTAAEDAIEILLMGGGKALLQGTTTAGDYLCSHTDGSLKVSSTTGDRVIAQALKAGVASDIGEVVICNFLHS